MARPLSKRDRNGVVYVRPQAIQDVLAVASQQDTERLRQRAFLTDQAGPEFLPSECLVYVIREAWRRRDQPAMNTLLPPLLARCERILRDKARGQTEQAIENVLSDFSFLFVEDGNEGHTDELDFIECRFNRAFRFFRIDCYRREVAHSKRFEQLPNQEESQEDGDERTFKALPNGWGAAPTQVRRIFREERLDAIKNLPPDEYKAVVLCGVLGLKEESEDPTITTTRLCAELRGAPFLTGSDGPLRGYHNSKRMYDYKPDYTDHTIAGRVVCIFAREGEARC